jgi:hypothetical protein
MTLKQREIFYIGIKENGVENRVFCSTLIKLVNIKKAGFVYRKYKDGKCFSMEKRDAAVTGEHTRGL